MKLLHLAMGAGVFSANPLHLPEGCGILKQ